MKKNFKSEKRSQIQNDEHLIPPDGKYGWIIVISYAITNFVGIATTSNFGLIFKDKMEEMKMPAADLTLIINTNSALSMLLGLINGPLLRHFGYRKISVIAALLFSSGLMLTAISDSIFGFIISYGVITAIGYGLSNSSFALAMNSFFKKNLIKASGVGMTLAGIGPIVYPPLINYLLHVYDVSGCMLIIAAIALHMLVAAILLQPLKWHMVRDASYFISQMDSVYNSTVLPNVSTYLSIGKFSESSSMPNNANHQNDLGDEPKSSVFEINHDIETQSIYGFDQIMFRPQSSNRLDQATIARNFSKRTLCSIPQNAEGLGFETNSIAEHQKAARKPLRCFVSGSIVSIHLGSSFEMFKEPITNSPNQNRRHSSVLKPLWNAVKRTSQFRRPSQHTVQSSSENEFASKIAMPERFAPMDGIKEVSTPETSAENTDNVRGSCCCSTFKWLVRFFDLDLLRDIIFLNIMIGMAISIFAEINFAILTPLILSDLQFDSDAITNILLLMALADLITRFCSPFIAGRFDLSIRMCYLISLLVLVVTRMAMMIANDYRSMLIVCVALGIGKGIRSVYMCIVVPSYIPIERLASASAIQLFANGIVMLCIGPILGLIKDISGSYVGCIIFLNICTIITIMMYGMEMAFTWYKEKCSKSQETQNS